MATCKALPFCYWCTKLLHSISTKVPNALDNCLYFTSSLPLPLLPHYLVVCICNPRVCQYCVFHYFYSFYSILNEIIQYFSSSNLFLLAWYIPVTCTLQWTSSFLIVGLHFIMYIFHFFDHLFIVRHLDCLHIWQLTKHYSIHRCVCVSN